MISIRGDVDVHGTFKIVLQLLTVPSAPPPKKALNIAVAVFVHVPHEFVRSSGRSRMSSRSAWINASPVRPYCESTQARRDLTGGK